MAEAPLSDAEFEVFCEHLNEDFSNPDSSEDLHGTCSLVLGSCRCHLEQSFATTGGSETYAIDGNHLINQDGDVSAFCVEGDTLLMGDPNSPPGEPVYTVYRRVGS